MEASYDALQEGMAPLKSGTAPGSDTPTEISPDPRPQKNSDTKERHHQATPPTNTRHHGLAVTILVASRSMVYVLEGGGTRHRQDKDNSSSTVPEEPTSTAKLRSSTGQSSQDTPDPYWPDRVQTDP
jgi:hypothetical protein